MPRRLPALLLTALLASGLAACGEDEPETVDALDAVEVSGDVGAAPKVAWGDGTVSAGEPEVDTVVEGSGPEVTEQTTALVEFWVGNGFSKTKSFSTWDTDGGGAQQVDLSQDLLEPFKDALVGQTVGSRVVYAANAEDAGMGEVGNPQLGIGNRDPFVMVFDILGPYDVAGEVPATSPGFVPDFEVDADGVPTAMSWQGVPKPTDDLQVQVLEEGDGPAIEADSTVMVDYLGQAYGKPEPFDTSYGKQPLVSPIGGLVEGWLKGLEGVPAGSRVVLAIPPRLGYGEEGTEGISGDDTIYFLIDVLGVG